MAYRVRRALAADTAHLVRLLGQCHCGETAGRPEALAAALANDGRIRCWVVEHGHAVVAALSVVEATKREEACWLIESIVVAPSHRAQGLTRLLLGAVCQEAQRCKIRRLHTLCSPLDREHGSCLFHDRLY